VLITRTYSASKIQPQSLHLSQVVGLIGVMMQCGLPHCEQGWGTDISPPSVKYL